jgi:hypothetical protein
MAAIRRLVTRIGATGVPRGDTLPSTGGNRPSLLMAKGTREAARIPAFAVVKKDSSPAAATMPRAAARAGGRSKNRCADSVRGLTLEARVAASREPMVTKMTRRYRACTTRKAPRSPGTSIRFGSFTSSTAAAILVMPP